MSYHQDWLLRQIEAISATLAYLLTGRKSHPVDVVEFEEGLAATNALYVRLRMLLHDGDICGAEDLLFQAIDENDPDAPEAAIQFYKDLNKLDDRTLESANFSRQEILDGLRHIGQVYGIPT